MPIVNYAKEYSMVRLLIGISLLCSHHWCQLAAFKKTRVHADHLGFWILGQQFGEINFFVFSGNTCKKCAGVYKGTPMAYFGGYIILYQQYVYSVLFKWFMYQQCLWCCKLLSFGCIWVINFVLLYIWLQKYICVQKYFL